MREKWYQEMLDELAKQGWTIGDDGKAVRIITPGSQPLSSTIIDIPMRNQPLTDLQRKTIAAMFADQTALDFSVTHERVVIDWINDRQLRVSVVS